MGTRAMVIASHPDDEILGSGGTIRKLVNQGCEVITVLLAKGRKEEEHRIHAMTLQANRQLGVKEVICLEYPNLELHTLPLHVIVKKIEALLEKYRPGQIFTHHGGDLNQDHQVTFQAVMIAARPLPGRDPMDILCFETVSSTEWAPNCVRQTFSPTVYVDVTDTIQDKLAALRHYDVEMRPYPHPRSYDGVLHLARVRGMTVGVEYAEAFQLIRRVWK